MSPLKEITSFCLTDIRYNATMLQLPAFLIYLKNGTYYSMIFPHHKIGFIGFELIYTPTFSCCLVYVPLFLVGAVYIHAKQFVFPLNKRAIIYLFYLFHSLKSFVPLMMTGLYIGDLCNKTKISECKKIYHY